MDHPSVLKPVHDLISQFLCLWQIIFPPSLLYARQFFMIFHSDNIQSMKFIFSVCHGEIIICRVRKCVAL